MTKKKIIRWLMVVTVIGLMITGIKTYKTNKEPTKYVQEQEDKTVQSKNPDDLINTVWVNSLNIEELKKYNKPILIDFTAEWCQPCKVFNPILEKTKKDLGEEVIIKIIDADKNYSIVKQYPIKVIPTQILIDSSGKPLAPKSDLLIEKITSFYKNDSDKIDLTIHEGEMSEEDLKKLIKEMQIEGEE